MLSLSLLNIPAAILAQAKSLIGGEENAAPARTEAAPFAPGPEDGWDSAKQDKGFWVAAAGADKRLAALRRAIDEAAAEDLAREAGVAAPTGPDSLLGESRCETANRVIAKALDAEKP